MILRRAGVKCCAALSAIVIVTACAAPPLPPAVRFTRAHSGRSHAQLVRGLAEWRAARLFGRKRGGWPPAPVRSIARAEAASRSRNCPTPSERATPFFSPDGSSIAYFSRGAIWRMAGVRRRNGPVRVVDAPIGVCRRHMDARRPHRLCAAQYGTRWLCPPRGGTAERADRAERGRRRARAWVAARVA